MDIQAEVKKLKFTSGVKFFDPAQQEVFPEPDFHLCTIVDKIYSRWIQVAGASYTGK